MKLDRNCVNVDTPYTQSRGGLDSGGVTEGIGTVITMRHRTHTVLLELDVTERTGTVTTMKHRIHSHVVTLAEEESK